MKFFAGSESLYDEGLLAKKNLICESLLKRPFPPGRVLVITEYIETGSSLKAITESLTRLGYSYDVVTVSSRKKDYPDLRQADTEFVSVGGPGPSSVYGRHSLAGVEKHRKHLHSTILRNKALRPAALSARRDVASLSEEIFSDYALEREKRILEDMTSFKNPL